jgi:hypothetical protein
MKRKSITCSVNSSQHSITTAAISPKESKKVEKYLTEDELTELKVIIKKK